MLSYRTALQRALVLAKSGRLELGNNIIYRSISSHCDIIGLKIYVAHVLSMHSFTVTSANIAISYISLKFIAVVLLCRYVFA